MIYSNSRYINTKTFIDRNGTTVLYTRKRQQFNPSNFTKYQVQGWDTLEIIAYKQLGDVNYKWAILDCNPHYLSEFDVNVGDIIYIPSLSDVRSFYG